MQVERVYCSWSPSAWVRASMASTRARLRRRRACGPSAARGDGRGGAVYGNPARMKAASSKRISLAAALTLGAAGCGPSIYDTYSYGKEHDPRRHEYIIGVSDTINVSVFHMPDLSGSGAVRPDGVITMPLIGDVQVAGKTPSQVREEMKQKLSSYVKADTVINVTVTASNSYRFTVTGNVNHAGSTQPKYFVTVAEAIAAAGGPNKFAGDQIVIFRLDAGRKVREIPISYKRLMSGKSPEMDICVVSGDSIVVQ